MAGYWIVLATERDADELIEYRRAWPAIAERYQAEIITGYGHNDFREGEPYERAFIVRFPSYEAAVACYDDADYQAVLDYAKRGYDRSVVIVDGE